MRLRICLLALGLAACTTPEPQSAALCKGEPIGRCWVTLTAEQTDPANAEADARAALERGDRHLWAGYTFNVRVYGAQHGEVPENWTGGVFFIQGMTDVIRSDEHRRFMDQTSKYAVAYNRVILASSP